MINCLHTPKLIIPIFKWTSFSVFILFFCAVSWAQFPAVGTYTYTSSTTITVPPRTQVTFDLQLWGGGGGAGGGTNSQGGGGGGAYVTRTGLVHTNSGNSPVNITVTVGTGGAPGGNGTQSTITIAGATYTAPGGFAGTGAAGGAGGVPAGGGSQNVTGGTGGSPSGNIGGGGGGSGASPTNGGTPGAGTPNGGAGGGNMASGTSGSQPGGGGGSRGNSGATTGSGGDGQIVINVTGVLPVELTSFTAILNEKAVEINWATANEINNEKFILETSQIGEVFNSIGEIRGSGTTFEPQTYRFTHHTPSQGINYYRLKQVDFDGTFAYSKVIAINAPGSKDIFAFPNPAKDKITVQYDRSKGAGNIQLFDALGRRVNANIAGYAGNYEVKLPDGLAKGTYWLKVERGGQVQTVPVVKE